MGFFDDSSHIPRKVLIYSIYIYVCVYVCKIDKLVIVNRYIDLVNFVDA